MSGVSGSESETSKLGDSGDEDYEKKNGSQKASKTKKANVKRTYRK